MAAPKKPEGEKLEQVKVHIPKKELSIYTRPVIESLIDQHRNGKHSGCLMEVGQHHKHSSDVTEVERVLLEVVLKNYRKSSNQNNFINRAKTLK